MLYNVERFADRIAAIADSGERISYRQLLVGADEIRALMPSRSVVAILCTNTLGALQAYFATLRTGSVPLLLSADMSHSLRDALLQHYQPAFCFAPSNATFPQGYECIYEAYGYTLWKSGAPATPLHADLALLLSTSGSTGSPKLVRQSYRNIQANAESIAAYLALDHDQRPITTLPMNYTYGLSIIHSHMLVGATLLMTDHNVLSKSFWDFAQRERATSFGGVPYTYEMLNRLHFDRIALPHLQTMTQAGGKLSPELHRIFAQYAADTGKRFVVMYGQTEATARMAYLPAEQAIKKCGSIGFAIPGGQLYLLDETGQRITEAGAVGELVFQGDNVTMGYAEAPGDLIKGDERGGVLYTGDMAKMDEDGYFYVVGRKKRFIKLFGNRVNLDELDGILKQQFPEFDSVSVGDDDSLTIFVTREDAIPTVLHTISELTGIHPKALSAKYIAEIPRSDSGKVQYKLLNNYVGRNS